jgi:hypothetical protein
MEVRRGGKEEEQLPVAPNTDGERGHEAKHTAIL